MLVSDEDGASGKVFQSVVVSAFRRGGSEAVVVASTGELVACDHVLVSCDQVFC